MEYLHQTFFYQNPKTRQPSSSTISAKQICRMLCTASSSKTATTTAIIKLETLVIEYDPLTNQYNTEKGWVPISSYPLFQFVASPWYYSSSQEKQQQQEKQQAITNTVEGPVTCRELASLYYDAPPRIQDDTTRVWSSVLPPYLEQIKTEEENKRQGKDEKKEQEEKTSWKLLSELSILKLAIEAFEDVINIVSFFTDDKNEINKKVDKNGTNKNNFQFNEEDMIYQNDDGGGGGTSKKEGQQDNDENSLLQEFLSSTKGDATHLDDKNGDQDEEEYESDGGTKYIKINNQWVNSKTMPPQGKKRPIPSSTSNMNQNEQQSQQNQDGEKDSQPAQKKNKKKKNTKAKFRSKNAKHWIYVTNLPKDTNENEVAAYFSKVGILDIDLETQKPKIKLYREKNDNGVKGDASVCYAKIESVDLAIQLLDDTFFRTVDPNTNQPLKYDNNNQKKISIQKAKFEQKKDSEYSKLNRSSGNKSSISEKKRLVAKTAVLQALTWDEGDYNGRITGGIKGLRIIVLKHVFTLEDLQRAKEKKKSQSKDSDDSGEDEFLRSIEHKVRRDCERFGTVEKITIFSKNIDGVVIVKLSQPSSASDAISFYNNKNSMNGNHYRPNHHHQQHQQSLHVKNIEASYWDGVTDYTVHDVEKEEKEEDKRHDDFGNWLDEQELPEELRLKVET